MFDSLEPHGLSMEFSTQEYWNGLPCLPPADLQSWLTLCNPIDGSPPGCPVPGILQARKDTGVGCHFLLQCMKVKSESEVAQSCLSSKPHGLKPTRLLRPWSSPGKSTGVGCHCLLWLITLGYHKTLNHSTFSHYLFIVDVSVSNTYNTYNVLFKTILMVLTGNSSCKQMM